jgi:capsular exopolysaccharide synthesis family protein
VFFEEARTPKSPTGLNPKLVGIVSAMAGAGFAISGLLLYLEFIDTKLYTENDIKQSLDLPVVSRIAKFRGVRRNLAKLAQPNYLAQHPFAESYRIAQTNLLLGNQNDEVRPIFLIASPQHNDGRTFTTINLAIIAAESGLNTLLIDADFRSPTLDRLFDVDNSQGFATLLGNWTDTRLTSSTFKDYIHETNFSRLYILPSGVDEVSLSSQILTFTNSDKLISQINQAFKYDVIFIDMPPSMRFADSYKLAGVLKADVILVSHKGNTNREDALRVKEQFGVVGCKVKGVIINEA